MKPAVRVALLDILAAIAEAETFIEGKTFADYEADARTRRAIERIVEIVSEGSRRIPGELKALRPGTPWRAIAQIGNRLRHEYQRIDDSIMWDIAHRWLRELRPAIEDFLERVDQDPER